MGIINGEIIGYSFEFDLYFIVPEVRNLDLVLFLFFPIM